MAKAAKRQRQKDQRRAKIEEEIKQYRARRRKRLSINVAILAAVAGAIVFIAFRAGDEGPPSPSATPTPTSTVQGVACGGKKPERTEVGPFAAPPPMTIDAAKTYTATIETSCGTVVIELADDQAPQTVNSFVFLANQKFFDGLTFHRVVKGFAIQGGDPQGTGQGGPGYKVTEAPPAGFQYAKGTVAMAKAGNEPAGTSGSQFFIVPGDQAATLPPEYALLGTVKSGFDVLAKIEAVPTQAAGGGEASTPSQTIYIVRITIQES